MSELPRLLRRFVCDPEVETRLKRLRPQMHDSGHGYDPFGANPDWISVGHELTRFLHDRYFRVDAIGAHHIPSTGPAIVTANHSGTLPFDAVMLWANLLRVTEPPRIARAIADYFVTKIPFINLIFSRMGVVSGSRDNARSLLDMGELLMIFPEGVAGIGKAYSERYKLQKWNWGHAELSIRHRAPVVPCAIIGAEEQMPQLGKLGKSGRFKIFGVPYIPIPATPLPLPVHYHIHYGEAIALHERYSQADADDPHAIEAAAREVQDAVQSLIERGLAARQGVFL